MEISRRNTLKNKQLTQVAQICLWRTRIITKVVPLVAEHSKTSISGSIANWRRKKKTIDSISMKFGTKHYRTVVPLVIGSEQRLQISFKNLC